MVYKTNCSETKEEMPHSRPCISPRMHFPPLSQPQINLLTSAYSSNRFDAPLSWSLRTAAAGGTDFWGCACCQVTGVDESARARRVGRKVVDLGSIRVRENIVCLNLKKCEGFEVDSLAVLDDVRNVGVTECSWNAKTLVLSHCVSVKLRSVGWASLGVKTRVWSSNYSCMGWD